MEAGNARPASIASWRGIHTPRSAAHGRRGQGFDQLVGNAGNRCRLVSPGANEGATCGHIFAASLVSLLTFAIGRHRHLANASWTAKTRLCARSKRQRGNNAGNQGRSSSTTLEKELRRLSVASRRRIDDLLRMGAVHVDDQLVRNPKTEIGLESVLSVGGVRLERNPPLFLKYHKPVGIVCTMKLGNEKGNADLTDGLAALSPPWNDILWKPGTETPKMSLDPWVAVDMYHPVGRLDRDTSGLLLLCLDGNVTYRLLSPARLVPRCYQAIVEGDVEQTQDGQELGRRLKEGVRTAEGIFSAVLLSAERLPARVSKAPRSCVVLRVCEGKYRMVRRMLFGCGFPVEELCRLQYGPVELGDIPVGMLAPATAAEQEWASSMLPGGAKKQAAARLETDEQAVAATAPADNA